MSWLTDLLNPQPSQSQIDSIATALTQFPQDQQRNRTLWQRWSREMDSIENSGKLTNGRRPSNDDINSLDAAIDAIEQASAIEVSLAMRVKAAAVQAINQGRLPADTLERMNLANTPGLGFAPIVILVIVIGVAIVLASIATIGAAWVADQARMRNTQARAQIALQYLDRTGQMPPADTLPGYTPPGGGGGIIENTERVVSMIPMLLLLGVGVFAFSALKGKR